MKKMNNPKGSPGQGRGSGQGSGRGSGQGAGQGQAGAGGVDTCICPNCGYEEPHQRGTPCVEKSCPKCGTKMIGKR